MTKRLTIILFSVLALFSCIENDLPEPTVDLFIASLDVEGTSGDIVIDRSTYTATIPLREDANINAVKFNSITFGADVVTHVNYEADNSKIEVSKNLNGQIVDMSKPEVIYLTYFQTYEWQIVATQTINRIWTVDGQIGATEWDVEGKRAIVKRRQDRSLENVKTLEVRFGPDNYSYPSIEEMPTNFDNETHSQNISVWTPWSEYPAVWELVIVPTLAEPEFQHIVGGANVVWIKANAIDGSEIVFKYRKANDEEWITTDPKWYATDLHNPYNRLEAGYVKAVLRGLEQNTTYEIQGWANTKMEDGSVTEIPSQIFTVTTKSTYQMPNSDMEEWSQLENNGSTPTTNPGPCWYPFSSLQEMFWGTGNPGGTSLGASNNLTYPYRKSDNADNVPAGSTGEVSAYLCSKFVANFKFAAGNLFVGHYGQTQGANATVYFGRPVDQDIKPVALRFWTKYSRGNINRIGDSTLASKEGSKDLTKVFICLTDWTEPHCVDSANKATFFDPRSAAGVLGLGYFDSDSNPEMVRENTEEWHAITLPIEYSSPEATPSHIVVTFTCSGYGDYFTGSDSSWMFVDDIELLYDLDNENQPK